MTDNTNIIEQIASKHLGKTSDGGTMQRYETPDEVDAELLVGIPRHYNRTGYGIEDDNLPFLGFDTWNSYEVSFLLDNGYPVSGVVKLMYNCRTPNIVESKSIKLYLNSYNMAKMGNNIEGAIARVVSQIETDLTATVGGSVQACFHRNTHTSKKFSELDGAFTDLESLIDPTTLNFDRYNEDPDILKVVDTDDYYSFAIHTNNLRSNCRVTNQPDWGDLYIVIDGPRAVTPESLMEYIVSMRKENHFHEEIVECVTKRLIDLLPGCQVGVCALYTRRGGIDINPVRGTDMEMVNLFSGLRDVSNPHQKTERQ